MKSMIIQNRKMIDRMFEKDHRVPVQPSGVERYFIFFRIPPSVDDTSIIVFVNFLIFHAVAFFFCFWETKDSTSRPIRPFIFYSPIAD